jgi:hypothetical protein
MPTYKIPVRVEYGAVLDVTADTWDEAVDMVADNPTSCYRKAESRHDLASMIVHVEVDWDIVEDFNQGEENGKAEESN